MKALVKKEASPGLWLEDVEVPEIAHDEVLIKVIKTAICGTDLHIYQWDKWAQRTIKPPMTAGHEFVGRVEAVGSHVVDVHIGDLVSGEGHIVCGKCRNCRAGMRHLCMNTCGVGVNRDGAFAEYIAIPVGNVWHCDPEIPLDVLSCFDPFGNATHTALSYDILGEDVLITGAGPIGIMAVAIARHAGARKIVITDVNPYRLKLAEKMGADRAIDVRTESLAQTAKDLGLKEGFDVGMEMSGQAVAFNDMLTNMAHGGNIALLGIHSPDTSIDWDKVIFNGLTIRGIYGRKMFETWYKMTVMIQSGLDLNPVITHRMHYSEYEKGFELMAKGECGKVILSWD